MTSRWICKICKTEYPKTAKTCLECDMERKELLDIWICCSCGMPNYISKHPQCLQCGCKKKSSIFSKDIITRSELLYKLNQVDNHKSYDNEAFHNKEYGERKKTFYKGLFAFLYLTGCRVSECLYTVKKGDVDFQEIDGHQFIIIHNLPTLKRRKASPRAIPINYEKEKDFIEMFINYYQTLPAEHYIIFPIKRQGVWKLCQRVMGKDFHPHYFRHLRNTHLAQTYGFNSAYLQEFNNWESSKSADFYIHLNPMDLARKML